MSHKSKVFAASALFIALLGCSNHASPHRNEAFTLNGGMDERLFNVKVTDSDTLLRKGDAHIERAIKGYRVQDSSSSGNSSMRILSENNQLIKVYPNPAVAPAQGSYVENAISAAAMYFGTPYEYGSDRNDPSTFDCSDFTRWAYLYSLGMDLPKDSRSQALYVQTYSNRNYTNIYDAQRGDLLFFTSFRGTDPQDYRNKNNSIENITHAGIYLGNGRMIHTASAATGGVRIDNVFGNHLEYRFVLGGSVLDVK